MGLAVATRLNRMPIFLALGVTWIGSRGQRRTEFRDTFFAVGIGILVFALQWLLFLRLAHDPLSPSEWKSDFGVGSPLTGSLAYVIPKRLGFYVVGQDHLALVLVAAISAGWFSARRAVSDPQAGD